MRIARCLSVVLGMALAACSGTMPTQATTAAPRLAAGRAHELITDANGCWSGRSWNDAFSDDQPVDRCRHVLVATYGSAEREQVERLRAFEPDEIAALRARIERTAKREGDDVVPLMRLYDASVAVQRETMNAKRAADRLKSDVATNAEPSRLSIDEAAALPALRTSEALSASLSASTGDPSLDSELRIVGLLSAMDRVDDARDIPKPVRVYAVSGPFELLFRVPAPLPADVTKPLKQEAWLAYLTEVARAAKRPVPSSARFAEQKELAAWAGAVEGLAEALRTQAHIAVGATQHAAVGAIVALDGEYSHAMAMLDAATATDSSDYGGQAVALVVRAASCWLGDVWSDALGQLEQPSATEARCRQLARTVYDDDQAAQSADDSLRWVSPRAVADVRGRLGAIADHDAVDESRKAAVLRVFDALASAAREDAHARHMVDRMKESFALAPNTQGRAEDKRAAAPLVAKHDALDAFLEVDAGELTGDARVLALLVALDRVQVARALPPELGLRAVAGPLTKIFGAPPPTLAADPATSVGIEKWTEYLGSVATVEKRPVPASLRSEAATERVAYTSVLEGFSERLRAQRPTLAILADVTRTTTTALDSEYAAARIAALSP